MKTYKTDLERISLVKEPTNFKRVKITSSDDANEYVRNVFTNIELFESVGCLLLNRNNNTIGWVIISQGGVSGTVVDVKIIAKYAIEALASSIILFHNHPSGNLKPSEQDKILTKKVKEGLALLDIILLDHIIITKDSYFSFTNDGIL